VARELEQFDRLEFAPGEEVPVDYGEGAMTRLGSVALAERLANLCRVWLFEK